MAPAQVLQPCPGGQRLDGCFADRLRRGLLGRALGGQTYKLKFGHHGSNQPVQNLSTRRVEVTSQNHGFAVDQQSLDPDLVEVTHINLNDNTVEGFSHKEYPMFAVQYHPEAAPGPNDANYLFCNFVELMKEKK